MLKNLRILLSGSSGFIGSEVFSFLQAKGFQVVRLRRGDPEHTSADSIFWNPDLEKYSLDSFEGFDAVIHLAGESIVGVWTEAKKRRILNSRVVGTQLLAKIFTQTTSTPKVFVSASAIGYYGNRGEAWLTENSSAGDDFLASVCKSWEASLSALTDKGIRVVNTRFGTVLGSGGGMLKKMSLPFRFGLGCILGSGRQWMSWIALPDLVRALTFCVTEESMKGAVNCVSPNPVRQEQFAKMLAKHLSAPLFLRLPAWLLRGVLGQMADGILLASQRVKPDKLLQHHFSFQIPNLEGALHNEHRTDTRN